MIPHALQAEEKAAAVAASSTQDAAGDGRGNFAYAWAGGHLQRSACLSKTVVERAAAGEVASVQEAQDRVPGESNRGFAQRAQTRCHDSLGADLAGVGLGRAC